MADGNWTRRAFLAALSAAAASLAGWRFLVPRVAPARERLEVETADVPPDGALIFRERRLAVVRGASGWFALDLTCTHLGCAVAATTSGFACPCHGSTFDREGRAVTGPATRALRRLALRNEGTILVIEL